MADQFETLLAKQMFDIATGSAEEVINANDVGPSSEQPFAEERAQEARPAGHQYSLFEVHLFSEGRARNQCRLCNIYLSPATALHGLRQAKWPAITARQDAAS